MLVHGLVAALLHQFDLTEPSRGCLLSLGLCKQKAVIDYILKCNTLHYHITKKLKTSQLNFFKL